MNDPQHKNNFRKNFHWLHYLTNRWSIAKKIGYGYTIAISISLIGTSSGLLLAYHNETYAYKQLNLSYQQQSLLKDLENSVTRLRLHPQRLFTVWGNSIWLEFEKNIFFDQQNKFKDNLSELEIFINTYPHDLVINKADFNHLLNNYRTTTNSYTEIINSLWEKLDTGELSEESRKLYYTELQGNADVNINIKFDQLSDELLQIIKSAEIQNKNANISFDSAQKLRIKVILVSMFFSVAIAAALAIYTSRLIARPIQLVTNVAKQITQESNFQLRANISSNDEVGTLANSLNQLVEWVGNYTQELELARQHLEQRVEERTQELELARQHLEQRVEERTQDLQKILQDLKETQGQLIQTEKMSSLGEMVAGIAHEINNPVNFIYGNIQCANEYIQDLLSLVALYQQEYPQASWIISEKIAEIDLNFLSKDLSSLLASMKMGAQRIREIVLSLRNFSRLDEADMKDVDIHEGIDNTLLILNHRIKHEIVVIKQYGNLPLVECYPAQLNQVFMNIISNAIDALLEQKIQSDKNIIIDTLRIDEHYIKVKIRDNGAGISPEIINKLFNPFFTTKPIGKGTGLGLSICYQIIDKHKGKIEVFSELEQGTEFIITLPIKSISN